MDPALNVQTEPEGSILSRLTCMRKVNYSKCIRQTERVFGMWMWEIRSYLVKALFMIAICFSTSLNKQSSADRVQWNRDACI